MTQHKSICGHRGHGHEAKIDMSFTGGRCQVFPADKIPSEGSTSRMISEPETGAALLEEWNGKLCSGSPSWEMPMSLGFVEAGCFLSKFPMG